MTTPISGRSRSTVRSDSSPSTTSQPSPAPALPPSWAISPPTSHAGSRPSSARTNAIIPVVVVFPCAPATTIARRSETSSARNSARRRAGHRRVRARDDGLPPLRHDRLGRDPHLDRPRAGADTASRPGPSRRPRLPTRARGTRTTRARRRRSRRTRGAYPRAAASAISSSAISSAASGRAIERIAARIDFEPRRIGEQLLDERGDAVELRLGHDDGAAAALEVPRVQRLVVGGRVRVRDEDRGRARRGELPDRAACPRDREIGRSEGGAELGRRRDEDVVVPVHPPAQALVVALARDVQHRRALVAVRLDREVVEAARAGERAEERDHRCLPRQVEATAALFLRDAAMVGGHRPAGDAVLRAVPARDAVGEEDAPRERRRQPVGEAEVGVRLRQRGGQLLPPGRVDHRPGDVAAAAEDDVRPPPLQDRRAGARRTAGAHAASGGAPPTAGAGSPEISKVSSSYPASGTSLASTRSGDPANVTLTPRSRSAAATASDGRTCPAVPPAAIRARNSLGLPLIASDVKEDPDGREQYDEARPAVGDERERNPGQRRDAQHGARD